MVISPTALLVAVTIFCLGVLVLIGVFVYFAWRFVTTMAVLRMTDDPNAAARILRAAGVDGPKEPEKKPMELPPTGIDELKNSREAIKNLRKQQDPTPVDSDNY